MKLTHYGIREWGGSGIIALIIIICGIFLALKVSGPAGWIIVIAAALIWSAIAAFFRVPKRSIPENENALVSPADGVVKDIETVDMPEDIAVFAGQKALRVGIFLSVLDVHVNRAPAKMKMTYKKYKAGRFYDARDSRCSKENESMMIAGTACAGNQTDFPVAVKQISGAIARRIVCRCEPGAEFAKGEIYGMIKFGSRTELYLPDNNSFELAVNIGDKVYAGSSIIAKTATTES